MNDTGVIQPTEFAQHQGGRTETGEGGLDQVHSDHTGEEQPPGADIVSKGDAEQDHGASENTNEGINFHG